jgi:predicted O-linked N-acetylglucosamine transferase (SPINDLY family)
LVHACGLPELACADEASYVSLAAGLANEPATLHALKSHIDTQRLSLPLFDTDRYARDYEALLQRMFDRHQLGLPPAALPALTRSAPVSSGPV